MFDLPPLPYGHAALEPWLSERTMRVHHDELHANYVKTLNQLTRGTHLAQVPLADLVRDLDSDDPRQLQILENAAQAWNHAFLWQSMSPQGGGRPQGLLGEMMGDPPEARTAFLEASQQVFGSGWVWLMANSEGHVQLWAGGAADNPMRYGCLPLAVCDVWEHAYFLDYPGERIEYVARFVDHLINWRFAEANYERAFG